MRVYKAFPAYKSYLDSLHYTNPISRQGTFEEQLSFLKDDFFPWVLSWSQFNCDRSVVLFETIHNDFYLQQSWAKNLLLNDKDWQKKIVLMQIKEFRPDVCVIYPPELFSSDFVNEIRDILGYPILVGGYDGMDRKNIKLYSGYDFVITCSRFICDYYTDYGMPTYPLEFGFDPRVLSAITSSPKKHTVGFSGSIMGGIHDDRLEMIRFLINKGVDLTISSEFENEKHYSLISRKLLRSVLNGTFQDFYDRYRIHRRNIGPLYGREMYQFLNDSDTVLNLHGDRIQFAANVRLYEATGIGTCLLTDWKQNIADIFEPDKEIVTFRSKEEAVDRLAFLRNHDSVRRTIALNGQKRTLAEYSYNNRIPGVIGFIKDLCG